MRGAPPVGKGRRTSRRNGPQGSSARSMTRGSVTPSQRRTPEMVSTIGGELDMNVGRLDAGHGELNP